MRRLQDQSASEALVVTEVDRLLADPKRQRQLLAWSVDTLPSHIFPADTARKRVLRRRRACGQPSFRTFAPYSFFCARVRLLYLVGFEFAGVKTVEAPGVEGRETTGDFVVSREVSCENEPDSPGKLEGADAAGSVSLGLMQARGSTEVREVSGVGLAGDSSPAADSSRDSAAPQVSATSEDVTLRVRLVALEHVLAAIGELLGVGDVERARALVRAWRPAYAADHRLRNKR